MGICEMRGVVAAARREAEQPRRDTRLLIDNDLRRLAGLAPALRFPRGGVGLVLATSLIVYTVYYVSLIGGEELGDPLFVSPFFAMWTPNLLFSALGLVGLWAVRRPGDAPQGGDWTDLFRTFLPRRRAVA